MLCAVSPLRRPLSSFCIYLSVIKLRSKYPPRLEANELACSAPNVSADKFQMSARPRHEKQSRRSRAHLQTIRTKPCKRERIRSILKEKHEICKETSETDGRRRLNTYRVLQVDGAPELTQQLDDLRVAAGG